MLKFSAATLAREHNKFIDAIKRIAGLKDEEVEEYRQALGDLYLETDR